jgi:hypothetical protein
VALDWASFEKEATELVVSAIERVVTATPGVRFYAAALHGIYREELGVISLPRLALQDAAVDTPASPQLDASPCDWSYDTEEWCSMPWAQGWEEQLTAQATNGSVQQWHSTFDRYLTSLVRICKVARRGLRAAGGTDRNFMCIVLDDEHYESLLRRCLTTTQRRRHFPAFDARAAAVARANRLPASARAEYFATRLNAFDDPITSEDAQLELRQLGSAAFPALVGLLGAEGQAWLAAKLLADIAHPDSQVIDKLAAALTALNEDSDRTWVACALSRLGRLDLVLAHIDRLAPETVAAAVAAPLKSFRDDTVNPLRLTYNCLEDFLHQHPEYTAALSAELAPGVSFCEIGEDEVDEALRGLTTTHPIIRRHAVSVLGDQRLGPHVAAKSLTPLQHVRDNDPDPDVRRLASLSIAALKQTC